MIVLNTKQVIITNAKCGTRSLEALIKRNKLGKTYQPLHQVAGVPDYGAGRYFTIRDPRKRFFSIYKYHTAVLNNPWHLDALDINTWSRCFFEHQDDERYVYWRWTYNLSKLLRIAQVPLDHCMDVRTLAATLLPGVTLPHINKSPSNAVTDEEYESWMSQENRDALRRWIEEDQETFKVRR